MVHTEVGEEAKRIAKQMFLNVIEQLIKHHAKLQLLYRTGTLDKEQINKFHKEELNLCYIAYPEIDAMRGFIESEHPEYKYMVDHIEATIKAHEYNVEEV
jgi:hypothetical protein